ncbi:MAG: TonB family protein [Lautropia sp.]|nr:TonB family protein [Lautropia sp.]
MRIRSCPVALLLALVAAALSSCATPPEPQPAQQESGAAQHPTPKNARTPKLSHLPHAINAQIQKAAQRPESHGASVPAEPDKEDKLVRTRIEKRKDSAKLNQEARMMLRMRINERGVPEKIEVEKSSGFPHLDQAAITAARSSRYSPYVRDGEPRRATLRVPIVIEGGAAQHPTPKNTRTPELSHLPHAINTQRQKAAQRPESHGASVPAEPDKEGKPVRTRIEKSTASAKLDQKARTMLRVLIDEQGVPVKIGIEKSSGFPRLDQAAIKAAQESRYTPHVQNGKPRHATLRVPIVFELEP